MIVQHYWLSVITSSCLFSFSHGITPVFSFGIPVSGKYLLDISFLGIFLKCAESRKRSERTRPNGSAIGRHRLADDAAG